MDQLPKPIRKQAPQPPKNEKKNPKNHESALHLRPRKKFTKQGHKNRKRDIDQEDAEEYPYQELQDSPPHGNPGLRRREFPAAALRADLGTARIHVASGAELRVITPATEIAVERFSRRDPSAFGSNTSWCFLYERQPLVSLGAKPHRTKEAVAVNGLKSGEPENLVG